MLVSQAPKLRHYYYPTGWSTSVLATPTTAMLFGEQIVLWRDTDGVAHGAVDRCPHRGARLSNGHVCEGRIVCPYHAWEFGPDGKAVVIPQLDEGMPIPAKARLNSVHVAERYGLMWVSLEEPVAGVPDFPEGEDPNYRLVPQFLEVWKASAPLMVDNFLDPTHTAVVHAGTVGAFDDLRVPPYPVTRSADRMIANISQPVRGAEAQGMNSEGDERDFEMEVIGPFTFIGRIRYKHSGAEHLLFVPVAPIDDTTSLFVQLVARADTEDDVPSESFTSLDRRVVNEDKVILETLDPDYILDTTAEIHLRSDKVTIEYKRYLSSLIAEDTSDDVSSGSGARRTEAVA